MMCLVFLLLLTKFSVALADDYLDVSNSVAPSISLTSYLGILEDVSQQLSIADIQTADFQSNLPSNKSLNLKFTSSAYWLRVIIKNSSNRPIDKIIELNYPLLKSVDFYWQIDQQNHQTFHTGYAQPYENRAYKSTVFAFPLQLLAHSQNVIYIRCATPNAMFIDMNLWEPSAFQQKELVNFVFQAFYFGILVSIFMFTLGLTIATKDLDYFIYLGMIFFMALAFITSRGLGAAYFWPNIPWLTQRGLLIFGSFFLAVQLLFICRVLNTKQFIPRLTLIAKGLITLLLIMPLLLSVSFKWVVLANILITITTAFVAIILLIGVIKKHRNAYFLTIGFSLLIIGIIIRELHAAALIETNFYSLNGLQLSSLFGLLVLSFFLTDRYGVIQQEKLSTDERLKQSDIKFLIEVEAHRVAVTHQIAFQAKAEKLRTILELSPDGIGMTDLDGIITFVSVKTMKLWGYTKQEFLGKHIFDVIDVSSHQALSNMIAALLKGISFGPIDYDMVRKDGSHFMCEVNCSLIYDIEKKPVNIIYIQRDVTERSKLAKELQLAKKTAEQASQAKSVFVSHMSHELRTPLNVILGYSELLQMEQSLDAEQDNYVQEILKGSNHLLMLINQMLDMAPIESGHIALTLHPENISTIIEDCVALVSPLAKEKSINLHYYHDKDIVTLCDRTRLMQLLLNLISNAIKYNVNQGSVEINVVLNDSHHYTINIKDTGQGMPANKLSVIFDPFIRLKTHEEIEGTGLGLSIVQELLVLMGGSIEVKSELGVGSHFLIKMPLLTEVHDQLASATTLPSIKQSTYQMPESLYPYRVLYVDDNEGNLKLTAKMFRDYSHFQLITVQDSTLAIAQALLQHPDVILLDINMPEMDGYQVLLALKANEQLKAIPVIALSANSRASDIKHGLEAGFSYYLTKPVRQTRLIQTIEQVLGLKVVEV